MEAAQEFRRYRSKTLGYTADVQHVLVHADSRCAAGVVFAQKWIPCGLESVTGSPVGSVSQPVSSASPPAQSSRTPPRRTWGHGAAAEARGIRRRLAGALGGVASVPSPALRCTGKGGPVRIHAMLAAGSQNAVIDLALCAAKNSAPSRSGRRLRRRHRMLASLHVRPTDSWM